MYHIYIYMITKSYIEANCFRLSPTFSSLFHVSWVVTLCPGRGRQPNRDHHGWDRRNNHNHNDDVNNRWQPLRRPEQCLENPRTKWWFIAGKIIYKWAIYTMAMLNNQMVPLLVHDEFWDELLANSVMNFFDELIGDDTTLHSHWG